MTTSLSAKDRDTIKYLITMHGYLAVIYVCWKRSKNFSEFVRRLKEIVAVMK